MPPLPKRKTPILKSFKEPTDIRQWWLAPHCGPGSLDINEICGFCGCSRKVCAESAISSSDYITCGGCGFWCSESKTCGRFWAQDACGERFEDDYLSCDGAKLTDSFDEQGRRWITCCCGTQLFIGTPLDSNGFPIEVDQMPYQGPHTHASTT